ncbi:MAG: nucleoside phosphorylase [Thermoprotei archaeon]|nr:MAG: nucleoside phosphorylase [Thermoprotei archaeon]
MSEFIHTLAKKPYHILTRKEDIASRVLTMGDPDRVRRSAELLEEVKLVNEHRGYLIYTGYYKGTRVSIACHGIGAPSAAIVFEELCMLGARIIVRLGTCGSLVADIKPGEVVVPIGAAYTTGGTVGMYVGSLCYPAVADPELSLRISRELRDRGLGGKLCIAVSSDSFHQEEELAKKSAKLGIGIVEMECATLFTLSRLRAFKAAAALIVIDSLVTGERLEFEERLMLERETTLVLLDSISKID